MKILELPSQHSSPSTQHWIEIYCVKPLREGRDTSRLLDGKAKRSATAIEQQSHDAAMDFLRDRRASTGTHVDVFGRLDLDRGLRAGLQWKQPQLTEPQLLF